MAAMVPNSTMDAVDMPATNTLAAMDLDTVLDAAHEPAAPTLAAHLDITMEGNKLDTAPKNLAAPTSGTDPKQASQNRLMTLPTEIRLMIFKELLQMPRPILFKALCCIKVGFASTFVPAPAPFSIITCPPESAMWYEATSDMRIIKQKDVLRILEVSKTVYMETAPLYYENTFAFDEAYLFSSFASKLRGYEKRTDNIIRQGGMSIENKITANIKMITSLDIRWSRGELERAAKKLLKFEGLRKLTIRIDMTSIASVTKTKPYEVTLYGMQHLLEIRGLEVLELNFPDRLRCLSKDSPEEVQNGLWNLAEGESRKALERSFEVLKQEKKTANRNKVGGQKAKQVEVVEKETDQNA